MRARWLRGGVATTLLGQWTRYVVQILSLVILSRLLNPESWGIYAMVATVTGLAAVVGDFGLSLSALQSKTLPSHLQSNLFWANLVVGLLTAAVICAISPVVELFYNTSTVGALLCLISVTFPLVAAGAQPRVSLLRNRRYVVVAVGDSVGQVLGLLSAVVAGALGAGIWTFAAQLLVAATASLLIVWTTSSFSVTRPTRHSGLREHLGFGGQTFLLQIVNYAGSNVDNVAIGRVAGALPLALYARAFQLVSLPVQQVATPLTRIFVPRLANAYRIGSLNGALLALQPLITWPIFALLSLVAATAPALIEFVFGARWSGAAPYVQILAFAAALQTLGYVYYWGFLAARRTRVLLWSELPGRLITIFGSILLAQHGPEFVAWSVVAGAAVVWLVSTFAAGPRVGLSTWPLLRAAVMPLTVTSIAAVGSIAATAVLHFVSGPAGHLAVGAVAWMLLMGVALLAVRLPRRVRLSLDTLSSTTDPR